MLLEIMAAFIVLDPIDYSHLMLSVNALHVFVWLKKKWNKDSHTLVAQLATVNQ